MIDVNDLKLGKGPVKSDPRTLRLARYTDTTLPIPPGKLRLSAMVHQPWPMHGNDRYGNCLAEGTFVDAPNVQAAYRIPYSGPMVTIVTEHGCVLTVTPNHAVLTPRGFVLACQLQEGDYAISGGGTNESAFSSLVVDPDFNQPPATVEEVFAALNGIRLPRDQQGLAMPVAADFHGDGRFMDGNVDVVWANRLLGSKIDQPLLSQPHREDQISTARELQRAFHRDSSPFQALHAGRLTPLCVVSSLGDGVSLELRHLDVAKRKRLPLRTRLESGLDQHFGEVATINVELAAETLHVLTGLVAHDGSAEVDGTAASFVGERKRLSMRSDCYASFDHPSEQGGPTDSDLAGELLRRFSGHVSFDRVVEIRNVESWRGHVYDLSTEQSWYSANGIITHNCVVAGAAHMVQLWSAMNNYEIVFPDQMVVQTYLGLTHGQDNGLVMLDFLNYWRKVGLGGQHPLAFATVNPDDKLTFKIGMQLFGGLYLGIGLPESAAVQMSKGQVWRVDNSTKGRIGTWGGHCVNVVDYDGNYVTCVTWGRVQKMTWGFVSKYVEEAYAIIPQDFAQRGNPVGGFDLATLQADLAAITHP